MSTFFQSVRAPMFADPVGYWTDCVMLYSLVSTLPEGLDADCKERCDWLAPEREAEIRIIPVVKPKLVKSWTKVIRKGMQYEMWLQTTSFGPQNFHRLRRKPEPILGVLLERVARNGSRTKVTLHADIPRPFPLTETLTIPWKGPAYTIG